MVNVVWDLGVGCFFGLFPDEHVRPVAGLGWAFTRAWALGRPSACLGLGGAFGVLGLNHVPGRLVPNCRPA